MTEISWQSLNLFDYAILAILVISALLSLSRGFVREVLSLVVWLVAIIVALKHADKASDALINIVAAPTARYIIMFIIILLVVLIIGLIINNIIRRLVVQSSAGALDRLLGFFFGIGRGVLLVGLLLLLMQMSTLQNSAWFKQSQLAPHFNPIVSWLHDFAPEKIQQISRWTKAQLSATPMANFDATGAVSSSIEKGEQAITKGLSRANLKDIHKTTDVLIDNN